MYKHVGSNKRFSLKSLKNLAYPNIFSTREITKTGPTKTISQPLSHDIDEAHKYVLFNEWGGGALLNIRRLMFHNFINTYIISIHM